jgi:hypothetical protein
MKCGRGIAVLLAAMLLTSCSAAPGSPVATLDNRGDITCLMLPAPKLDIPNWDTPVAFSTDIYVNLGQHPAVLKSVSLLSPHGLVLHHAFVYEMVGARHVLYQAIAWSQAGRGALPSAWVRRQPIPGAVIPTGHTQGVFTGLSAKDNLYVVVEEITDTSPRGGWALGEKLTYRYDGQTYTVESQTGIGIGSAYDSLQDRCNPQIQIMRKAFNIKGAGVVNTG